MKEIIGCKVRVYRNLHKKCFSVVNTKTNRVICHTNSLSLSDVKFIVRQAGRNKVLMTKQKNVHAFVYGVVVDDIGKEDGLRPITYNPYVSDSFFDKDTGVSIDSAFLVKLDNGKDILAKI